MAHISAAPRSTRARIVSWYVNTWLVPSRLATRSIELSISDAEEPSPAESVMSSPASPPCSTIRPTSMRICTERRKKSRQSSRSSSASAEPITA